MKTINPFNLFILVVALLVCCKSGSKQDNSNKKEQITETSVQNSDWSTIEESKLSVVYGEDK